MGGGVDWKVERVPVFVGAAGDGAMKKMGLFVAMMVFGIALMLWAGWHNLRERRLVAQQAAATHMKLTPDGKGGGTAQADGASEGGSDGAERLLGKPAPAFKLTTLDGKKVSLADYKGRPVLVNFWATWCAPCKLEMPWFAELQQQYAPQGFTILGINQDPEAGKDKIAATAQRLGVNYPVLLPNDAVAPAYGGVDVLPTSFYVDRSGVISEVTAGLASKDEIEAHIKKIVGSPASTPGAQARLEPAGGR